MKTVEKKRIISSISATLIPFGSEYRGVFLCPVCFARIPIAEVDKISLAHILPQAAGGKKTTWLCRDCNSRLGAGVDKWLGEYLNMKKANSILAPGVTVSGFSIDNVRMNGRISRVSNRIDVLVDGRRNPKAVLEKFKHDLDRIHDSKQLSVKIPLLGKMNEVDLGFLTAAYLYGFSILGYSWVMQSGFDNLRAAIVDQDLSKLEVAFVSNVEADVDTRDYYFGIASLEGHSFPCIKILSKVAFFSSGNDSSAIKSLKERQGKYNLDIKKVSEMREQNYTRPFLMTIGNQLLIYPDKGTNKVPISFVIFIDEKTFQVSIMDKLVNKEFEEKCRSEGIEFREYNINLDRNARI